MQHIKINRSLSIKNDYIFRSLAKHKVDDGQLFSKFNNYTDGYKCKKVITLTLKKFTPGSFHMAIILQTRSGLYEFSSLLNLIHHQAVQ